MGQYLPAWVTPGLRGRLSDSFNQVFTSFSNRYPRTLENVSHPVRDAARLMASRAFTSETGRGLRVDAQRDEVC